MILGVELASLETFQAGKSFNRFSSYSFSFVRRGEESIYQASFLLSCDYGILCDCLWGNIRHYLLDAFGTRISSATNKSCLCKKRKLRLNFKRNATIFTNMKFSFFICCILNSYIKINNWGCGYSFYGMNNIIFIIKIS